MNATFKRAPAFNEGLFNECGLPSMKASFKKPWAFNEWRSWLQGGYRLRVHRGSTRPNRGEWFGREYQSAWRHQWPTPVSARDGAGP